MKCYKDKITLSEINVCFKTNVFSERGLIFFTHTHIVCNIGENLRSGQRASK